jgi:hypothetical protein
VLARIFGRVRNRCPWVYERDLAPLSGFFVPEYKARTRLLGEITRGAHIGLDLR